MELSTASKLNFHNSMKSITYSLSSKSQVLHTKPQEEDLTKMINEYISEQNKEEIETETNLENEVGEINLENGISNNIKPLRMFKDEMELKKENQGKKIILKELENLNEKLKHEYQVSLSNNKKMENFLKEIEFTFKNDRSNQKANETLLKATKTLHREQQESKNYIEKLVKTAKTNEMRELKAYLKVLENEKGRLLDILTKETIENEVLRKNQDFNESELDCFDECQEILTEMLQDGVNSMAKTREVYKKEKCRVRIMMSHKEADRIKKEMIKTDKKIVSELLRKEGLEYEKHVMIQKMKEKNKRSIEEEGTMLKEEIKLKKRKLVVLRQELKEKTKTHEYISKWTKELKFQLEELRENHINIKQNYEEEINQLSQEIEEWNRRYKAELIEEQTISKNSTKKNDKKKENSSIERKIRVVKFYEIDYLRKKLFFYLLENNYNPQEFIYENIFLSLTTITLKQLHNMLLELEIFEDEENEEIFKLARYIIEDNNSDYIQINSDEEVEVNIAALIFKNLLAFELNHNNMKDIKEEVKEFLKRNFDAIRHEVWMNSGKASTFNCTNLHNSLTKFIREEIKVSKFSQFIEFSLWKKFGEIESFKITNFEKFCELLLGIKLVKDSHNRISKTTIKSVFEQVYNKEIA